MGETPERASLAAVRKAFVDGLLARAEACTLLLPRRAAARVDRRPPGGVAGRSRRHRSSRHARPPDRRRQPRRHRSAARRRHAARVRLRHRGRALAARRRPVSAALRAALPALADAEAIRPGAITAVHLWFDGPLGDLRHAVLVDRLSQWVFADPPVENAQAAGAGRPSLPSCHRRLARPGQLRRGGNPRRGPPRPGGRLAGGPPASSAASSGDNAAGGRLLGRAGLDRLRPPQQTPVANLFLAGDWTATGWPATMKGAVRSGRLAVEALLAALGRPRRLLVPDLPRGLLARWLCGRQ